MKSIAIAFAVLMPYWALTQHHCNCETEKIAKWNEKNVGKNLEIVGNPLHFQHPATTFYRWGQNNWFDPLKSQAQNLATLRQMLIKAFNSDFEHPSTSNFHKFRAVYKNIYDQAQNTEHLYYDPEESEGHSNYTAAKTARACAFVLLCATNLAGSRLVYAPMPVTLGMKRFHPILPSTRANYFQDMFTTYPTTSR